VPRAAVFGSGGGPAGQKGGFAESVAAEVGAEAERLIGGGAVGGIDFEAVETQARRLALDIMGKAVRARLNADHGDAAGARLPCACGGSARYAGRRDKTFTTVLGEMTLSRAWYHCGDCGRGFAPRDRELGMADSSLSPGALRMTGLAAARLSFAESGALLRELAGLDIDPKSVERHAGALGGEMADDERRVTEPEPNQAHTLYLGVDGTGVPVRKSETAGRAGKQPDGSAKTREAKVAVVWSAESFDKQGAPVRDPDSASYNAAIETAACRDTDAEPPPFVRRVLREARRRGFDDAPRRAVLGDGAAWIWNLADEHFPGAVQIVAVFHAKQHLFDTAKAIYGAGSELADAWGKQRRDELDRGRLDELLAALDVHATSCESARKDRDYFSRNRKRMRYPAFRAMGLCVTTGIVEGACKNLVGGRLKRGGMHWTVNGANAILALRCAVIGNRFDDFWKRRANL